MRSGPELSARCAAILVVLSGISLGSLAQKAEALLEAKLPTITREACAEHTASLIIRREIELSVMPVQDRFRQLIPQVMPRELNGALVQHGHELGQLHEAITSGRGSPSGGDQVLRSLAEQAQRHVEESYGVDEGKAVTPLMAFLVSRGGEVDWCLYYLVIADAGAFHTSPAFSAERVVDKTFVIVTGRDVDRTQLAKMLVVGWGRGDMSLLCGVVSPENLPSPQR
jgi:hypothetical protein